LSTKAYTAGVPQGYKLGLILLDLFVNDIPQSLIRTNIAFFADGTTIFTESCNIESITTNLQAHLNTLSHWCQNWWIKIKSIPYKSIRVIFSLCRYVTLSQLNFDSENISYKPTVKYSRCDPTFHLKSAQAYSMFYSILNQSYWKNALS